MSALALPKFEIARLPTETHTIFWCLTTLLAVLILNFVIRAGPERTATSDRTPKRDQCAHTCTVHTQVQEQRHPSSPITTSPDNVEFLDQVPPPPPPITVPASVPVVEETTPLCQERSNHEKSHSMWRLLRKVGIYDYEYDRNVCIGRAKSTGTRCQRRISQQKLWDIYNNIKGLVEGRAVDSNVSDNADELLGQLFCYYHQHQHQHHQLGFLDPDWRRNLAQACDRARNRRERRAVRAARTALRARDHDMSVGRSHHGQQDGQALVLQSRQ